MKQFVLFSLIITFSGLSVAQDGDANKSERSNAWQDRITFGGGGGFSGSNGVTVLSLSPMVGYRITDEFIAGIRLNYIYYHQTRPSFSESRYGGGLFGRYFFFENLFAHAEYEVMQGSFLDTSIDPPAYKKQWVPSLMIGGGYAQSIGSSGVNITVLYIVNHDPDTSPYGASPLVIRAGVMF